MSIQKYTTMEQRVERFYTLCTNPWYPVMNWVLGEIDLLSRRSPTSIHISDGWEFYGIDRHILKKTYRKRVKKLRTIPPSFAATQ